MLMVAGKAAGVAVAAAAEKALGEARAASGGAAEGNRRWLRSTRRPRSPGGLVLRGREKGGGGADSNTVGHRGGGQAVCMNLCPWVNGDRRPELRVQMEASS